MLPATISPRKWARKCSKNFHTILSVIVFSFLDFFDTLFCVIYRYLDQFYEGNTPGCYCAKTTVERNNGVFGEGNEVSETLYGRKNVFWQMGFLGFAGRWKECREKSIYDEKMVSRWSDCGCESCISWMKIGDHKLHFVVKEPSHAPTDDSRGNPIENVIFLHGFLSSSSLWTETVFENVSEPVSGNYRLIAVDLLGFGGSPKPRDSLYTLKEHLDMIEKSVIRPYDLKSFHLVAHSMGCVIALAVAAKHSKFVKSVTLVAPPYLPCSKDGASLNALNKLAERKLWPPLSFGAAFMSWYEHLGRCVCFFFCRNHRKWESIMKLLTQRRDLHFTIMDLTKHTHHSAWCSMHNVICGGAKYKDDYLNTLIESRVKVFVVQGDKDQVVPVECSINIKMKVPDAEVNIIPNANHITLILGREKEFTETLEQIWISAAEDSRK